MVRSDTELVFCGGDFYFWTCLLDVVEELGEDLSSDCDYRIN